MEPDRRQHRRLEIRLPIECIPKPGERDQAFRTVTINVSTGGLYFEADMLNGMSVPPLGSVLDFELTVPPGDGHFPYESRLRGTGRVVRCLPLDRPSTRGQGDRPAQVGIGVRFQEPLRVGV